MGKAAAFVANPFAYHWAKQGGQALDYAEERTFGPGRQKEADKAAEETRKFNEQQAMLQQQIDEEKKAQEQMRKDAEAERARLSQERQDFESGEAKKKKLEDKEQTSRSARARQRAQIAGSKGRRSTILTGSLGVKDQAPTRRKTLLGA